MWCKFTWKMEGLRNLLSLSLFSGINKTMISFPSVKIWNEYTFYNRNPGQKDEFDSMLDKAPENVNYIKRNLLQFCNSLLKNFGIKVENLDDDFSNGINLIILIGVVEGKFYSYIDWFIKKIPS